MVVVLCNPETTSEYIGISTRFMKMTYGSLFVVQVLARDHDYVNAGIWLIRNTVRCCPARLALHISLLRKFIADLNRNGHISFSKTGGTWEKNMHVLSERLRVVTMTL